MSVTANLARVRSQIDAAARRCQRDPASISLMAVTKTFPADAIREAYSAGQRLFGENRVQEFAEKSAELNDLADAQFHLIGHLQSNKSAKAAELFCAIDSVDSLRLLRRLDEAARGLNRSLDVLIEINIGGEEAKSGVAPDSPEFDSMLLAAPELRGLRVRGLMTVPPFTEDPEDARPYFRRLRELRERVDARHLPAIGMNELSMGMSHDFEIAIEEGSTCVRVGSAIFGTREKL